MKVKVQCPCGSKFEFEVEPVNGRMPVAISCPTCGADATALANEVIQRQSPAAAPAPPIPVSVSGLRINKGHAAPAQSSAPSASAEETPAAPLCPKHKTEPAVENCRVCGKPICLKCMEQFGYVCSVYCRQQAERRRIDVPVYAYQKTIVAGKSDALVKRLTYAISFVVVALLGFWFWYAWFARDPKIVYSVKFLAPVGDKYVPPPFYELIGPGHLVLADDKKLSLFDTTQNKTIWTANLLADNLSSDPHIIATTNDIWIYFPDRISRFDRATGSTREVPIKGKIENVSGNGDAIIAVSENSDGGETLNRISMAGGEVQNESLKSMTPSGIASATKGRSIRPDASVDKVPIGGIKNLVTQSQAAPAADNTASDESDAGENPFIPDGTSVVQMETKVLEHKTISHVAMKAKGKSILDSGEVTASQGLDVAQEMMNDSHREATGGVEIEDVSRYQVTLHRYFAPGVADWTGEIIGPPRFYALKTVDIICAGQSIYVFDKNNKKLWDAKLTFSVANRFKGDPCLETKDALYFADLGVLTRFDLQTGNVRWRYNTVGISKIQTDRSGAIYIDTTTAGPESITYSQEVNIKDKIHPVIARLNPDTGKVDWNLISVGDTCYVSGKFLYSTMASTAMAALHLEDGPDRHYYLNLLDPKNGHDIWSIHRGNEHIFKTEMQNNWILIQFREELIVMKFFSL